MDRSVHVPEAFVAELVEHGAIASPLIRGAFARVPRHRFLEGWYRLGRTSPQVPFEFVSYNRDCPSDKELAEIYSDKALVTALDGVFPSSSTSQPRLVAIMLEFLDLRPGQRILEIGTGTGYNAALLAEAVGAEGHVSTLEIQEDVAARAIGFLRGEGYGRVSVHMGDAFLGVPEQAPFDRIEATVGCSDISPHWLEQLSPEGVMLIPLRHGFLDPLVRIEHAPGTPQHAVGYVLGSASFMPIQGVLAGGDSWSSFLLPPTPEQPTWTRSLPSSFSVQPEAQRGPLDSAVHQAFQFFLSLNSRELFVNGAGYGLADPGTGSRILLSGNTLRGFQGTTTRSLDCLDTRMDHLIQSWQALDCPALTDYTMEFLPPSALLQRQSDHESEWMIVRPGFVEIVRLR